MNADNREPRAPFSGVTPAGSPAPTTPGMAGAFQPGGAAQQAPSSQTPVSGAQPTRRPLTGQQPQGTGQSSGQQPTSAPSASGTSTPQRTSVRSALSGNQPASGAQPTSAVGAPFGGSGAAVFAPASSAAVPTSTATSTDPDAPRRAKLMLQRIDPLSAIKMGFLLSVAAGVMLVVAVYVLWNVLNAAGTFALANEWVSKLFTEDQELNLMQFFHQGRVMSATILIAVVNVFILTVMSAIWAFLYNTVSTVVGGVFVTLSDE